MAGKRNRTVTDANSAVDGTNFDGTSLAGGDGNGAGTVTLDPGTLGTGSDGGTGDITGTEGTGKKQRKPRVAKAKAQPLDINTVKNSLILLHMGVAAALSSSELMLSSTEADAYAIAVSDVMSHYDTGATAKTMSWINLVGAVGGIYWGKMAAVGKRKAGEKAAQVQAGTISRASMGQI